MQQTALGYLAHGAVCALFVCITVIQLNDPDPAYWIVTYGLIALLALGRLFGRRPRLLLPFASGLVVAGLLIAAPGFVNYLDSRDYAALLGEMYISKPYIESAREFLGLAMAAMVLVIYSTGRSTR